MQDEMMIYKLSSPSYHVVLRKMSFIAKAALVVLSASERPSMDVVKCLQLLGNNSHKKTHMSTGKI